MPYTVCAGAFYSTCLCDIPSVNFPRTTPSKNPICCLLKKHNMAAGDNEEFQLPVYRWTGEMINLSASHRA